MKKLFTFVLSLVLVFGFSVSSFAGDWLVRSKVSDRTLWADGSITVDTTRGDPKTDYNKQENRCHNKKCSDVVDLNEWKITASGITGIALSFLTFQNPDNEREVVRVFFDRTGEETIIAIHEYTYSAIDGTRDDNDGVIDDYDVPLYSEARLDR